MSNKPVSLSALDYKELTKLAEFMEKMNLSEIEVIQEESSIRLGRNTGAMVAQQPVAQAAAPMMTPAPLSASTSAPANALTAPMVGTFYRAPSPDADPFVKPGDRVKKGQVIGIIEAMKTMNQIEAERAGVIKTVLIDNAQPIEFGEPLFVLED